MKNIHILPTDKPSRLFYNVGGALLFTNYENHNGVNIYITNSEEIKEVVDQWYLDKFLNKPRNSSGSQYGEKQNVIILTTDQELINDGVQKIDDGFLEWFVKNPSCEDVEVVKEDWEDKTHSYEIIIPKEELKITNCGNKDCQSGVINGINPKICRKCNPKEEPKQETLEEVAENFWLNDDAMTDNDRISYVNGFVTCAKWQQDRICDSEVLQRIRASKSDAEARRIIRTI